ncbi:MAG: sulfatase-like hydrolase/transferase [Fimbriimonadaceae bacterium]|nr:sulfatase-like hydrolase/transferase [Chitinophagales bacterium]
MKQTTLLITCLILVLCSSRIKAQCTLIPPTGLTANLSACEAKLSWNPVAGADRYQVRYKNSLASTYTYFDAGLSSTATISIDANIKYTFSVKALCASGGGSGYSLSLKKKSPRCSPPENAYAADVTYNSLTIYWDAICGGDNFTIKYRETGTSAWSIITNITTNSVSLTALTEDAAYEYQLRTNCTVDLSSVYSSLYNFTTLPAPLTVVTPNILLIVLDDGKYDSYTNTGGPEWFSTPNIDRIAEEGAIFTTACAVTPLCAPSRATFYTGLYPHAHGCIANQYAFNHDGSETLVQQVLKENGYLTGFIGKYGQGFGDPMGFDWWYTSTGNGYVDPNYKSSTATTASGTIAIPGNILDTYPQLALDFLNSTTSDQPFALFYFHRAPHDFIDPRESDLNLYIDEEMSFPDNYKERYADDYPSYLYDGFPHLDTPEETASDMLEEFQALYAVDEGIGDIMEWLETNNELDSTIIIFTSDNGYIEGEHDLSHKGLVQNESLRVPMFIRYPSWFEPNTVINNAIAANVDVPTTLLEIAGIENTYGMQGLSLHDLATGEAERTEVMHELGNDVAGFVPNIRSIRSFEYVYSKHYCDEVTEELYDIINDPQENTNIVNDPAYATILDEYRIKLENMRIALDDTADLSLMDCYLINDSPLRSTLYFEDGEEIFDQNSISIYPNPVSENLNIFFTENVANSNIIITDALGRTMYEKNIEEANALSIDCAYWNSGIYTILLYTDFDRIVKKITITH